MLPPFSVPFNSPEKYTPGWVRALQEVLAGITSMLSEGERVKGYMLERGICELYGVPYADRRDIIDGNKDLQLSVKLETSTYKRHGECPSTVKIVQSRPDPGVVIDPESVSAKDAARIITFNYNQKVIEANLAYPALREIVFLCTKNGLSWLVFDYTLEPVDIDSYEWAWVKCVKKKKVTTNLHGYDKDGEPAIVWQTGGKQFSRARKIPANCLAFTMGRLPRFGSATLETKLKAIVDAGGDLSWLGTTEVAIPGTKKTRRRLKRVAAV